MSHTPGPWEWDLDDETVRTVARGASGLPRDIIVGKYVVQTADGHLLAAAPDLFNLVNDEFMGLLDGLLASGTTSLDAKPSVRWIIEEVRDKARAAIAKARGETT